MERGERTLKAGMRNVAHTVKVNSLTKEPLYLAGTFLQPRAKDVDIVLDHPENYRELYRLIEKKKVVLADSQKKIPMENEMIVKTIKAASVSVIHPNEESRAKAEKVQDSPVEKVQEEEEDEFQAILREGVTKGASKRRTKKGEGN